MKTEQVENLEIWKKAVKNLKEYEIFLSIESLGSIITMTEKMFQENQEYYHALLNECLPILKSFGVDPESVKNRSNGDYWKWYNFWKSWRNAFSDEGWKNFEKKWEKEESIEDLLPKKRWNE